MCPLYLCLFSSLFFCLLFVLLFCYSVLFFCYSVFIFYPSVFVLLLLCLYFLSFCLCSSVTLSLFSVFLSLFFYYSVFIICPSVLVLPASKQKKDHRIFKEGPSISGDHLDSVKQELWATVLHRHLLQVFLHRAGAAVDRVVVLGIPAHGIC